MKKLGWLALVLALAVPAAYAVAGDAAGAGPEKSCCHRCCGEKSCPK